MRAPNGKGSPASGAGRVRLGNLYRDLPPDRSAEAFDTLLQKRGLRLERIVSRGHVTPAGEWYDQDMAEWVLLLRGAARLRIEGRDELIELAAGDYVHLPAHRRHRVEWTDPECDTIWLALHHDAS
ncbi:cupin domain-containing protein [Methylococcus sp. EFPC2]|uniref:cupin domain-containing protein n=1 Tax=Methylococcus sp. EFPC2 TaxID=2812648 RepID=UPI001967A5E7|nr:cupin domain-containing protein [Methylococcus sp. EFPC2]QSA95525.1 cupin domain-containing protein [Methylococcus sp. EFPC2]